MSEKNESANGQASLRDRVRELQLTNRLEGAKGAKAGGASAAWLPWLLCGLLALAWAGWGIRSYKASAPAGAPGGEGAKAKQAGEGAGRTAVPAGEILLDSKGYLIPSHTIPISPIDVAGRVTDLYIEEGKSFKKGDVLARIDPTRFDADVKEAEASVASARARYQESKQSWEFEKKQSDAELSEAKAQAATAEIEYLTAKNTNVGAVSKQDLATLLKKWESAREHVNVLVVKRDLTYGPPREQRILATERDLAAAEARLKKAVWSLDNCTIRSPVTGIILTKKAEKDSLINPVVGGVSTSLCEIADLSQIEVDLEIQERDIAKVKVGNVCRVRPSAFPERVYEGYVDRMMPIANRARGIIPVRVKVILPPDEKQGLYLKPEMGVDVTFINTEYPPDKKSLPDVWRGVQEGAATPRKIEGQKTEDRGTDKTERD
jgi:HlyD family secretion protein